MRASRPYAGKRRGTLSSEIDFRRRVRLASIATAALAVVWALVATGDAVRALDADADKNTSIPQLDRLYGTGARYSAVIRDTTVVEAALAAMPPDATFTVAVGPRWKPVRRSRWTPSIEADFLRFYLFPRRLTDLTAAGWAFCLRCRLSTLGTDVRVVSRGRDGMSFVQIRR